MARAKAKQDLLLSSQANFSILLKLIENIKEHNQYFNFNEQSLKKEAHWKRDKNIRDVLTHLYEWHQLLLNWVNSNQKGDNQSFLPNPYTWKTYGQLNQEFFEKHQNTSYEKSKTLLVESHNKVIKLIEIFSNDELFSQNMFSWTGKVILGSYFVSSTSSHYIWAIKKIKKHISS